MTAVVNKNVDIGELSMTPNIKQVSQHTKQNKGDSKLILTPVSQSQLCIVMPSVNHAFLRSDNHLDTTSHSKIVTVIPVNQVLIPNQSSN